MKRILFTATAVAVAAAVAAVAGGCNNYNETPPLNEGYLRTYIMPDPVYMSNEDWEVVDAMVAEYDAYCKANGVKQ